MHFEFSLRCEVILQYVLPQILWLEMSVILHALYLRLEERHVHHILTLHCV